MHYVIVLCQKIINASQCILQQTFSIKRVANILPSNQNEILSFDFVIREVLII